MHAILAVSILFASLTATPEKSVDRLLAAMRVVESGDCTDAVGDGGRAIGPYQIHRSYWKDAGVKGRWAQCRDRAYAERVVRAYWHRYCPDALAAGDLKTLARVHNGGPRGHAVAQTAHYWSKVHSIATHRSRSTRR